jgi:predicted nucleic acid-binding protein
MILVDSGFWLALVNPRDGFHARARKALERLREPLVTTWPVLTEAMYMLLPLGARGRASFRDYFAGGGLDLVDFTREDVSRMLQLMDRYADLPMDLADASLVVAAERLETGRIVSTDLRDFDTYRWKNHHPFTKLLLEEGT